MTVFAPTVDALPVASLSDRELDAFVRRVAELLTRSSAPQAIDAFCDRIEGLLERADLVKNR
jgi:hypothetical protein